MFLFETQKGYKSGIQYQIDLNSCTISSNSASYGSMIYCHNCRGIFFQGSTSLSGEIFYVDYNVNTGYSTASLLNSRSGWGNYGTINININKNDSSNNKNSYFYYGYEITSNPCFQVTSSVASSFYTQGNNLYGYLTW